MADILLYNALKHLESSLNVKNSIGIDIGILKNTIRDTILTKNYDDVVSLQPFYVLSCLSCNTFIAHCNTNYAGSSNNGTVGGSLWTSLSDVSEINLTTLYSKLIQESTMYDIVSYLSAIESTTIQNNIKQFAELYAKYVIETSNSDIIKGYWLKSKPFYRTLKVCGEDWNLGQGASCTWTVPEDATKVKFQLWGAGAGSAGSCCCGGSQFGANGAYAELTIAVTPGDTYSICAGCTCSLNSSYTIAPSDGCMTGVIGPGICCLKADGGCFNHKMALYGTRVELGQSGCCRFENPYLADAGGSCFCTYGDYCTAACATCGVIPVHADCCTGRTYCACGSSTTQIYSDGYRSLHGGGCLDSNNCGYHTRPPLLDSDTCSDFSGGCSQTSFGSSSCFGSRGDTWTRHPGHGGADGHTMAASMGVGGRGTGGLVQVSWE